ncbi:MAG: GTPase Era [Erysipelothrix sp.]|nr:GTPase Era [Erysipelothrix sp.]
MSYKSGFVAIIGQPNAGKSTLLNTIMTEKVAIVSDKAQTTRQSIRGILTTNDYQIVFIDTPGIHEPKDDFGRFMNKTSYGSIEGVEVIYFISDAKRSLNFHEKQILNRLQISPDQKIYCVVIKIDEISSIELIKILENLQNAYKFDEIIPISAKTKENVDRLLKITLDQIQEGPQYFSNDEIVDYKKSFQIKEIIREKVLYVTEDEIPHLTEVLVENIEEQEDAVVIDALLVVSKESMKPIIIGKHGQMIAKITRLARKDIRKIFNKPIDLQLYVKVEKDWRSKQRIMSDLGYMDE